VTKLLIRVNLKVAQVSQHQELKWTVVMVVRVNIPVQSQAFSSTNMCILFWHANLILKNAFRVGGLAIDALIYSRSIKQESRKLKEGLEYSLTFLKMCNILKSFFAAT
jgi:hypothetical protein